MFTKTKIASAVAIAVTVAGTGAGLIAYHPISAGQRAPGKPQDRLLGTISSDDDKGSRDDDAQAGEEVPNRDVASDNLRSQNNLKHIAIALHNFHDQLGHFPSAASYDKDRKPLLSWRVAILPHLGREAKDLYKEFNLDEPWNSDANKKLLARMPAVFKAPGIKTKKPNTTYYQLIVGNGALFNNEMFESKISDIKDGTSNTILVIEAQKPVPWSKPEDLTYDPEKALPKFGGVFTDGFNFVVADGSAHFCKKGFEEKKMRAAITCDGGESVNVDDLKP